MAQGIQTNLLVATAIIALAAPGFAQAQADDTLDAGAIVVTARRTEERLQDVPISITVYNQDQVNNRNILIPGDLATYTPSLSINQRFGPEKASFAIRGFNQENGTAPTVGVYFAEVPGIRAQGSSTAGNSIGAGAFMDLQNVQVVKGPQGTLFGLNTTGGAVLVVPQKPTESLEGYVEGQVGKYDMKRVQAVLNVPLADTFKVRLAADRMKRDGYMRNRSGIGPDDYNDTNYLYLRGSLLAELTPDLENYTVVSFSDSNTNAWAGRMFRCDRTVTSPATSRGLTAIAACNQLDRQAARGDSLLDVEINVADPYMHTQQWQAINTTTWTASDTLTVKNIASYGEFFERARFSLSADNFFIPVGRANAGAPFQHIQSDVAPGRYTSGASAFTDELQLQGNTADGRLTWVIGGFISVSRPTKINGNRSATFATCNSPATLDCTNPTGVGVSADSSNRPYLDNQGIFAQGTYKVTDRLSLTLGGRYTFDQIRVVSENTRYTLRAGLPPLQTCNDSLRFPNAARTAGKVVTNAAECNFTFRQSSKRPTWLVNLDYKPSDDIMLYAKYARGYRQGGINPTNIGLESWGPEKVDAYEIGAKTSFRGAVSGFFNVAAFYNDFRDMQLGATLVAKEGSGLSGGRAIINAGSARIQGIEVDGSVRLFDGLQIDLGYTYLDAKLKMLVPPVLPPESPFSAANPTALPGETLGLSPKHKLTASASYTLPLDESVGDIQLGGTYTYTSSQIAVAGAPLLPATNLLNLNVTWKRVMGSPVDFAVFGTNVTNELYPVNTNGGFASSGYDYVVVGQPRIWGVRLRYNFGT